MIDSLVLLLRDQAHAPALSWLTQAADEIERLRCIVLELMPFMVEHVVDGVRLGPAPCDDKDGCRDCRWFDESLEWQERINSGEFDDLVFVRL